MRERSERCLGELPAATAKRASRGRTFATTSEGRLVAAALGTHSVLASASREGTATAAGRLGRSEGGKAPVASRRMGYRQGRRLGGLTLKVAEQGGRRTAAADHRGGRE